MDLRHSSRLMCVSQRLYPSFKPIVVDLRFILVQHYQAVSTDTKLGRDKPFCFPCAFPLRVVVSSPAVLLPCCCRCLVYDHALPWLRWILLLPSAHRRRPLFQGCRAGSANLGGCAVNAWLPAQRARPVIIPWVLAGRWMTHPAWVRHTQGTRCLAPRMPMQSSASV